MGSRLKQILGRRFEARDTLYSEREKNRAQDECLLARELQSLFGLTRPEALRKAAKMLGHLTVVLEKR